MSAAKRKSQQLREAHSQQHHSIHPSCGHFTQVSDPSRDGPCRSVLHCAASLSSRLWSACFRRVQLDYGQKTHQSRATRLLFGAVVLQAQIVGFGDDYENQQQLLQETRRAYRELFYCADIGFCISGAIMNKEMVTESDSQARPFTACLTERGVLPGVKVDEVGLTRPSSVRIPKAVSRTNSSALPGAGSHSDRNEQGRDTHERPR